MAGKKGHRSWGRIRRLPSKRYQANYVGPDLVRHNAPSTFTTKMDAEAWLQAERRSMELGSWVAPNLRIAEKKAKTVTLAEYAQTWIDQRHVKPRTRIGYQALHDRHIAPTLGRVPLTNLTPESVRGWFASLGTEHVRRNSHAYGLLHAICKTAIADGLILANPCNIPRVMNPPRKREPVILSVSEVAALADAIRPERFKAFVLVSAWCGMRWGEATELRRKDIGEGCGVLYVSRYRRGLRPGNVIPPSSHARGAVDVELEGTTTCIDPPWPWRNHQAPHAHFSHTFGAASRSSGAPGTGSDNSDDLSGRKLAPGRSCTAVRGPLARPRYRRRLVATRSPHRQRTTPPCRGPDPLARTHHVHQRQLATATTTTRLELGGLATQTPARDHRQRRRRNRQPLDYPVRDP